MDDYENVRVLGMKIRPDEWEELKDGEVITIDRELDENTVLSLGIGRSDKRGEASEDSPKNLRKNPDAY